MSSNIGLNRNSKLILRALSDVFLKKTQSLFRGEIVSISFVDLSPDLKNAKVYISTLNDNKKDVINKLTESQATIKKELARNIKNQIRKIPDLTFLLDNNVKEMLNISAILQKICYIEESKNS
jgi:ribosome-binding factor A